LKIETSELQCEYLLYILTKEQLNKTGY
jgi:hypothetical protein